MRVEFWSSVEYSGFMESIIAHLQDLGIADVSQHFQISEHSYRSANGFCARLLLRLRMYVVYPVQLAFRMLFDRKTAVIIVTSNTFYAPLIACVLRSRHQKVVHLLYDLYPDALVYAGSIRDGSGSMRIIDRLTSATLHKADANVFLASGLLEHVRARFAHVNNPQIIPVGTDDMDFGSPMDCKAGPDEPVRVLYCGNMGNMHDIDTLASALPALDSAAVGASPLCLRIDIHSSGTGYNKLLSKLAGRTGASVTNLSGYLPARQWLDSMRKADVALVTMKPGAEKVVMPSKTYSAMQAAQAVIAVTPAQSDLARTVMEHDCGWVIAPGDSKALEELLRSLPSRRAELRRKQLNANAAACEHYSGKAVAAQWVELIQRLCSVP
jgi:glycosyltransferase involved in cell wall biosynthesis